MKDTQPARRNQLKAMQADGPPPLATYTYNLNGARAEGFRPRIVVFEASASNTILPHLHMARKLRTALWKIKLADAVCSE